MTLYANADCNLTFAIRAVAHYANVYLPVITDATPEDVATLSANGKLPVLRTNAGSVFGANAIVRYLARSSESYPLYGGNDIEAGQVDSWLDWSRDEIEYPVWSVLLPAEKLNVENMSLEGFHVMKDAIENLKEALTRFNDFLMDNTYLAGKHITIADIIVAASILPVMEVLFDKTHSKKFSNNVSRWLKTVLGQPIVGHYFGDRSFPAKKSPIPANPPKRKKTEDAGDEPEFDAEDVAADVSYLQDHPTTFSLFDLKTKYANAEVIKPEVTDYFWANYDPSGYHMVFFHYNKPESCTVQFITANLFGGFLQRCDAIKNIHKHSLASMVMLEKDGLFHIYGVWLFRGNEIPPPLLAHVDDFNYYSWTVVDVNDPAQVSLVSDFLAHESDDDFQGKGTFVEGKTFGF